MTDERLWRSWGRWLRKHFPVRCDSIRIVRGLPADEPRDHEGCCRWKSDAAGYPTHITIYVRADLRTSHTAGVLIHEWAHAYRAQIPHAGTVDDERALHAVIERLISNRWDKLRGTNGKKAAQQPADDGPAAQAD